MEIPEEKQYEYLTRHLEYLNEKIIQFFTLFIKLATAIVGGVFFIHWKLPPQDDKRVSLASAADWLFILVTVSMILLIVNNLRSWFKYRKTLSEQYPKIPNDKNIMRWLTEVIMCIVIAIACIGFIIFNPL
jgi:UDP-N-acetylmuramyl pentapeptide phosphotransferase/UDP-N-acetylglucosamine-1-phosphate transferase